MQKLISTLHTPSEAVQVAVSFTIPPLIRARKDLAESNLTNCLQMCFEGELYGTRRGGAFGVAGIVSGFGCKLFEKSHLLEDLNQALMDKKNVNIRQGAIFCYEALTMLLGRALEPYMLKILPFILSSFGDSSAEVREATHQVARVIMQNMSSYCVRLHLDILHSYIV